jgi:hypothetical protein
MSFKSIPALRFGGELNTVACVAQPPESVGLVQGRDYVVLDESDVRRLIGWLQQALPDSAGGSGG